MNAGFAKPATAHLAAHRRRVSTASRAGLNVSSYDQQSGHGATIACRMPYGAGRHERTASSSVPPSPTSDRPNRTAVAACGAPRKEALVSSRRACLSPRARPSLRTPAAIPLTFAREVATLRSKHKVAIRWGCPKTDISCHPRPVCEHGINSGGHPEKTDGYGFPLSRE